MEGTVLEMWKETTGNGLLLIGRIGRTKEVWRCTQASWCSVFSVNAQWASAAATVLIQHKAVEKENSCATRTWSRVCTHPDKRTQTCTFIIAQHDSSQRSSQECFSNYILHFTLEFLTVHRSLDLFLFFSISLHNSHKGLHSIWLLWLGCLMYKWFHLSPAAMMLFTEPSWHIFLWVLIAQQNYSFTGVSHIHRPSMGKYHGVVKARVQASTLKLFVWAGSHLKPSV